MIDPSVEERFRALLRGKGLTVAEVDNDRPWGGEFLIDEDQVEQFTAVFFADFSAVQRSLAMPKLLLLAPHQRFSWQYHHRRKEIWLVLDGPVGLISGRVDEEPPMQQLETGQTVEIGLETRHRLVGLNDWGVVAELWMNSDVSHPSAEDDIVRVADDYHRR